MSHFSTDPHLFPRPGDFHDLVARAQRRRARRRLAIASVTPLVALGVALGAAVPGGAPTNRLGVAAFDESPSPKPEPSGEPSGGPVSPGPVPNPLPSILESLNPQPDPSPPSPKPRPSEEPSEDPSEHPSPHPSEHRTESPRPTPPTLPPDDPARFERRPDTAPADCVTAADPLGSADRAGWCSRYLGPTEVGFLESVGLPFEVCRATEAGEGTLTSTRPAGATEGTYWLKTAVNNGEEGADRGFWYWAAISEPTGGKVTVAAGECLRWTVGWDGRDDYGRPLAPGSYTGAFKFLVEEPVNDTSDPDSQRYELTIKQ